MESLKHGWKRTPKGIRQPLVFIVGWTVVAAGVIMLVTPGPGWGAIFVGFAILATEFTGAQKVRDTLVHFFKRLAEYWQKVWRELTRKR